MFLWNSELVERLQCHFNTIKPTDTGSEVTEACNPKENAVVDDDEGDNVDIVQDKVHQDGCDENFNTSPAEKPNEEIKQPKSNKSSPKRIYCRNLGAKIPS